MTVTLSDPPLPAASADTGRGEHPYVPDVTGTQCSVSGCWGWVDDPRHMLSGVGPVGARMHRPRHRRSYSGRRWHLYGPCEYPPCGAAKGLPCVTTVGRNVGREARDAHAGRPMVEPPLWGSA